MLGNRTQVAYCVRIHHDRRIKRLWFHSCICLHSSWILCHFTLLPEEGILVSWHFPKPLSPFFPSYLSPCPLPLPHPCLSFSISFLGHLVNLFSDMPNSCSVSPCLVSPLVLSSDRTSTVSYVHRIILLPKNLTCTDWTTQSRVQVALTPSQMHTSAVFLTHHPRRTHLQSWFAPISHGRPCPELGSHGKGCGL